MTDLLRISKRESVANMKRLLFLARNVAVGASLAFGGCAVTTLVIAQPASATPTCGDVGCSSPTIANTPKSGTTPNVQTLGTSGSPSTSRGLAFTGSDIAGMTIFAFGALGLGSVIVVGSRRRARSA